MGEQANSKPVSALHVILILVCLIAGTIWVATHNFIVPPRITDANRCINNLRQINVAANQFALENNRTNGDAINFPDDLTPYIKLNKDGKIPSCPQGGVYSLKKVGEVPTCSLSNTVTPAHILP